MRVSVQTELVDFNSQPSRPFASQKFAVEEGSGGVGSVYLVKRAIDSVVQWVALKVLAPHACLAFADGRCCPIDRGT